MSADGPRGSQTLRRFGYKDGYTFENAAKDIGELADHLGKKEFIVTGHSVGTSWSLLSSPCRSEKPGISRMDITLCHYTHHYSLARIIYVVIRAF